MVGCSSLCSSGPIDDGTIRWYGVGGTIQLGFFAMVAAKVKMNANGAHTFLEVGEYSDHRCRL